MNEDIKKRIDLEDFDLDLEKFGEKGLPLGLIFMDEMERIRERAAEIAQVPERELTTVKKENFTKDRKFLVKDIDGLGALRTFMILADSANYSVIVETDKTERVDDTYSDLENLSAELVHVGAYEKDGEYMVNVTNYPFRENLKIAVVPGEEILFSDMRAEIMTVKRPHLDPDNL